jgi:hypothetical protein
VVWYNSPAMATTDPRVDAYIQNAAPFAQPILRHLRDVVHEACPEVEETMKWSVPHFDYKGVFCSMAAFKAHTAFGFWKASLLAERLPTVDEDAMGHFGRIRSIDDLPARKMLVRIVKAAAKLNDDGVRVARVARSPRRAVRPTADLAAALAKDPKASTTYKAFSASQKREYVEWIAEAKQPATRERRVATAIEWMAAGKPRHWKYAK